MPNALHILVTCTKRKAHLPLDGLVMRDVGGRTVEARLGNWLGRVRAARGGAAVPAASLYAGDHWQISRELSEVAASRGFGPRLWVVSAGYGLIESTAPVHPYSAAFSPGHPDCVLPPGYGGPTGAGFAEWWAGMAKWAGPSGGGAPRTIASLMATEPRATFLIVASELYLRAVWADLLAGVIGSRRALQGRLAIVSAGTKDFGPLAGYALPVDARMQTALGGARRSLNVRMARLVLSWMRPGVEVEELRKACADTIERAGVSPQQPRRPGCTDDEVIDFIRAELPRVARPSPAALLRRLRDLRGRACEQRRFSRLFRQATAGAVTSGEVARA